MRREKCEDKNRKNFNIPIPSKKRRILLYLCTLLSCSLSLVSLGMDAYPEWLKYTTYVIAFCTLWPSGYYIVTISRKEVKDSLRAIVSHNSILDYLYSNDYQRAFWFTLPGFGLNLIFAGFNAVVGIRSMSAWYISFAVYYGLLCLMRFYLLHYEFLGKKKLGQRADLEWKIYFRCGILLMLMSIALGGVVILMVVKGQGKSYPGYLIYVVALYTFWKIITAAANMIKAGKSKSPVLSGIRNIGYADALVSVLSLQTAMFASFNQGDEDLPVLMNALTGSFVCLMVVTVGGGMALAARKQLKRQIWRNL